MSSSVSELWFRSFNALNHKMRIKILPILLRHSPRSANEVRIKISANEVVFNYHISVLENARLIRKFGNSGQYSITKDGKQILAKLDITNVEQDSNSAYAEMITTALNKLKFFEETAYGPKKNWVTVLGAFDTWPYMDHVCGRG